MNPSNNSITPVPIPNSVQPLIPTKKSHKPLILIITTLVLISLIAGIYAFIKHGNKPTLANKQSKTSSSSLIKTISNPNRIRLLAAGDFIAHDSVNSNAKQADGSYNYMPIMSDFKTIFKAADIRFCNDAILNGGSQFGISGYPKFNSPTEFVDGMAQLGCNLVNTASNHSFDRTQDAINASVNVWDKQSGVLAVAGENRSAAEQQKVSYFTQHGLKFAFLAYTTYSNNDAGPLNSYGVNSYSRAFAHQQIQAAKQAGAQIIIVSMRWGTEYTTLVNDHQKSEAQYLADEGVTLILGHGSHELEPVQKLKGSGGKTTTVWYSLGNFINTQEPTETLFNGLAVIDFDTTTHQISSMSFLPIYVHYEWTASQAKADAISTRHNLHIYSLENTTQAMIDSQQLHTTVAEQKSRLSTTLNTLLNIPLVTTQQYYN